MSCWFNSLNVTCTVVSVIPYILINFVKLYFLDQFFISVGFNASPPKIIYLITKSLSSLFNSASSKL